MFRTLRTRLIAISVGITAISLITLAAVSQNIVRNHTFGAIDERIDQLSDTYANELTNWVAEKQRITSSIKTAFGRNNEEAIPFLRAAIEAGAFDDAYIVYREPLSHVFVHPMPDAYDGSQRPWYKETVEAGRPVMLSPYIDASTGKLTISFAEPVIENGQTLGVVGSDLHLETVSKIVAAIRPQSKSFAFLIDNSGQLIAAPQAELTLKPLSDLSPALNATLISELAEAGAHAEFAINGEPQLIYASSVKNTPWTLAIVVDKAEATASLTSLQRTIAIVVVLSLILASLIVGFIINRQLRRLNILRDALENVASGDGDLTYRLATQGGDELAQIADAFNRFISKLSGVIVRVREGSDNIATAADEIESGNMDLSSRTEEQAASVEETAATLEQLTATINNTAGNTAQAYQYAAETTAIVKANSEVMNNVSSRMQEIYDSSTKMSDIIQVIDGIAFQTNILALNAAVEAARAGESGRGFAVVAGEVRTLAQRSASSAREIKELIGLSVARIDSGRTLVEKADSGMTEIVSNVQNMTQVITAIAQASREQSDGIAQINLAMGQIDTTTQQNAALVEQSAAAAASMKEQSQLLQEIIRVFRLEEKHGTVSPSIQSTETR